jgi:hypothetical protein
MKAPHLKHGMRIIQQFVILKNNDQHTARVYSGVPFYILTACFIQQLPEYSPCTAGNKYCYCKNKDNKDPGVDCSSAELQRLEELN